MIFSYFNSKYELHFKQEFSLFLIMEKSMKNKNLNFFLLIFIIFVVGFCLNPIPVHGVALCSSVNTPGIVININGQNYSNNATINVSQGAEIPFTVYVFAEPSSRNTINYSYDEIESFPGL